MKIGVETMFSLFTLLFNFSFNFNKKPCKFGIFIKPENEGKGKMLMRLVKDNLGKMNF